MDFAVLVTLLALLVVSGTTLFLVRRLHEQQPLLLPDSQREAMANSVTETQSDESDESIEILPETLSSEHAHDQSRDQQTELYIKSLERQIHENNQDISLLGQRLAAIDEEPVLATPSKQTRASADADLVHENAVLEARLRDRDQQITWLHMDLAKFQKQRQVLEARDREISELTAELGKIRSELRNTRSQSDPSKPGQSE